MTKSTTELMTAIQEFASTYSLAGTRFDDGTIHDQAMQQKEEISKALEALAGRSAAHGEQRKAAERISDTDIVGIGYWHGLGKLANILDDDQWRNVEPLLLAFGREMFRRGSIGSQACSAEQSELPPLPDAWSTCVEHSGKETAVYTEEQMREYLMAGKAASHQAIVKASEDAKYVFKDSCDHTHQAIEYMKALLIQHAAALASAPAKEVPDLLSVLREVRHALQYANDNPGGGISDTIWMMHRPETLFDFIDAALEAAAPSTEKKE